MITKWLPLEIDQFVETKSESDLETKYYPEWIYSKNRDLQEKAILLTQNTELLFAAIRTHQQSAALAFERIQTFKLEPLDYEKMIGTRDLKIQAWLLSRLDPTLGLKKLLEDKNFTAPQLMLDGLLLLAHASKEELSDWIKTHQELFDSKMNAYKSWGIYFGKLENWNQHSFLLLKAYALIQQTDSKITLAEFLNQWKSLTDSKRKSILNFANYVVKHSVGDVSILKSCTVFLNTHEMPLGWNLKDLVFLAHYGEIKSFLFLKSDELETLQAKLPEPLKFFRQYTETPVQVQDLSLAVMPLVKHVQKHSPDLVIGISRGADPVLRMVKESYQELGHIKKPIFMSSTVGHPRKMNVGVAVALFTPEADLKQNLNLYKILEQENVPVEKIKQIQDKLMFPLDEFRSREYWLDKLGDQYMHLRPELQMPWIHLSHPQPQHYVLDQDIKNLLKSLAPQIYEKRKANFPKKIMVLDDMVGTFGTLFTMSEVLDILFPGVPVEYALLATHHEVINRTDISQIQEHLFFANTFSFDASALNDPTMVASVGWDDQKKVIGPDWQGLNPRELSQAPNYSWQVFTEWIYEQLAEDEPDLALQYLKDQFSESKLTGTHLPVVGENEKNYFLKFIYYCARRCLNAKKYSWPVPSPFKQYIRKHQFKNIPSYRLYEQKIRRAIEKFYLMPTDEIKALGEPALEIYRWMQLAIKESFEAKAKIYSDPLWNKIYKHYLSDQQSLVYENMQHPLSRLLIDYGKQIAQSQ